MQSHLFVLPEWNDRPVSVVGAHGAGTLYASRVATWRDRILRTSLLSLLQRAADAEGPGVVGLDRQRNIAVRAPRALHERRPADRRSLPRPARRGNRLLHRH